jgi:T-complex protein 1 subunit theta
MSANTSYFSQTGTFNSLLKEGFRHYKGAQEAVLRNIEAINDLSSMTKTAMGPNGMNKYIINMHDKLFLTKDTKVMTSELDINHPAANIIVDAAKAQDQECGDGTNFVITLAGELLNHAGELIVSGVHLSDIIVGYEKAFNKTLEYLDEAPTYEVTDLTDVTKVTSVIKPAIGSKMVHGQEKFLAPLIAQACINVLPEKKEKFNVDNVRVAKILGGSLMDTKVIQGLVVVRNVEGSVTKVENCKVAVYNCPLETQGAETSDEVVFKNAEDLLNYTKGEEAHMESIIKRIVDSGVKAIVVGGAISNMAIHYLDKYQILAFRVTSKFELRRIAKALGATLLVRLGEPTPEEMGQVDSIAVTEISSTKCIQIERSSDQNKLSTIILRGTTNDMLDNMEHVIEDGVNAYKAACKSAKYIPGAGAIEMFISNKVKEFGKTVTTLDQYGIDKFGEAFEVVPRILLENSGHNVNELLATLRSKSLAENSTKKEGIDIKNGNIADVFELGVYDHLETKRWGIKLAVHAALTILRVDQVIVAKPAGGPNLNKKPPGMVNEQDEF